MSREVADEPGGMGRRARYLYGREVVRWPRGRLRARLQPRSPARPRLSWVRHRGVSMAEQAYQDPGDDVGISVVQGGCCWQWRFK
jgi:hypothetical protein